MKDDKRKGIFKKEDNKNINNNINNNLIIFIILIIILLLVTICIVVYNKIINIEYIKLDEQSKTDEFISAQMDLLPYYLHKNSIVLENDKIIKSSDLFSKKKYFDYDVMITNHNGIYSYNFKYDNKLNNNSYKLFSTEKENMEISNYFESSDGYMLIIKKNIEYENHKRYIEDENSTYYSAIEDNDLEIQKYDDENNLKWIYEIKNDDTDMLDFNYFHEFNNRYYFYSAYNNSILVLDLLGNKVNEVYLEDNIDRAIGSYKNYMYFISGNNYLISLDLSKENLKDSWDIIYTYSSLEVDEKTNKYEKCRWNEKEKYGLLSKENNNKKKSVNVRFDYDKLYRMKSFTYDFYNDIKFNNDYIYVPLTKVYDISSEGTDFYALLIYDKNLKLHKVLNYKNKRYKIGDGIKEKLESIDNIYFYDDKFTLYGNTTNNYLLIETYTNKGKKIKTNLIKNDEVSMEYEDITKYFVNANENSITYWDNFYYKDINYLKVTEYIFK